MRYSQKARSQPSNCSSGRYRRWYLCAVYLSFRNTRSQKKSIPRWWKKRIRRGSFKTRKVLKDNRRCTWRKITCGLCIRRALVQVQEGPFKSLHCKDFINFWTYIDLADKDPSVFIYIYLSRFQKSVTFEIGFWRKITSLSIIKTCDFLPVHLRLLFQNFPSFERASFHTVLFCYPV